MSKQAIMKLCSVIISILIIIILTACSISSNQPETLKESKTDVTENDKNPSDSLNDKDLTNGDDESGALSPTSFSAYLPPEFMAYFEGHRLSVEDNPVIGTYKTTSGCIMILLSKGYYVWQDTADSPAITGSYEIFEGTVKAQDDGENTFILESDTGSLYTVIVTFDEGQNASAGTVQVFDYIDDSEYYVTDLLNNIWFEAVKIV